MSKNRVFAKIAFFGQKSLFWPKIVIFDQKSQRNFWVKWDFWARHAIFNWHAIKTSIFGQTMLFWPKNSIFEKKTRFLVKNAIFWLKIASLGQKSHFYPEMRTLVKTRFLVKNCDFWPRNAIFGQQLVFWSKIANFGQNAIFGQEMRFRQKLDFWQKCDFS